MLVDQVGAKCFKVSISNGVVHSDAGAERQFYSCHEDHRVLLYDSTVVSLLALMVAKLDSNANSYY